MLEQAADFRAESDALYQLLAPSDDADFARTTQFKGWTFGEVIGHLHVWNYAADLALTDEPALIEFLGRVRGALAGGTLRAFERDWLGDLEGTALRERWREFYTAMAARFAAADPKARLKWAGPDMSVRSAITARLMETWAHGQAIYDALGVERVDDDRIRNIVILGIHTFAWSFTNRKLPAPGPLPHLRLTAPSGDIWEWPGDNPEERIEGRATEFCQVVTQVRNVADTALEVRGPIAQAWMAIAQCFAGPVEGPPAPGTRFRQEDPS